MTNERQSAAAAFDEPERRQAARTRRALLLVGLVAPVVLAAATALLVVSLIPELPNPIATHWSGSGGPDGYGSVWTTVFMPLLVIVPFGALAVGTSWRLRSSGLLAATQKLLLATNLFLTGMLCGLAITTLAVQRGLSDAAEAGSIVPGMLVSLAAGIVLATVGWFLLPAADSSPRPSTGDLAPLQVTATERVVWSGRVRMSRGFALILTLVIVVVAAVVVLTATSGAEATLISAVVLVVVLLAVVTTSVWRVTVDRRGFVTRSLFGWPRFVIHPEDVASVRVIDVSPMADFGGWGVRWVGGRRVGIVLRAGEAIEVTRRSGSSLVVTVNDAETGARALDAVAAREGRRSAAGS